MIRGAAAVLLTAVSAAVATTAAPSSPARAACGFERWAVKTLQDRPQLLRARPTTVAHLDAVPAPHELPPTRLPFEHHVFTVLAAVTLVRHELDQDLHLVLRSGPNHMIAEAPAPACTVGATPYRRRQMANARKAVRLCARAKITGVAFFDFKHGQTGVAPNAIELHPILDFVCSGTS